MGRSIGASAAPGQVLPVAPAARTELLTGEGDDVEGSVTPAVRTARSGA
ncbi:hypothetical protein [Streptomyces sp. SID14515]|nr:hypothetical protein [Streptomyces sp. SID14515]NEB36654.1 hypothetical protein [Streptomyces sp. SID14515]